jgi:3-dehydroquinate dehydratase II
MNLLGQREPDKYGSETLEELNERLQAASKLPLETFQSNAEHEIIDRIHETLKDGTSFIIINPAAFTHTSIAIRDALLGVAIPFIEVHLTDIKKREAFRQHSYFSDIALEVISGLGTQGYFSALSAAETYLTKEEV